MAYHRKKDPVPDPAHYDSLISDRIKCARQDPDSPEKWMELGLLCEARIEMIKNYARGISPIRYFILIYLALLILLIVVTTRISPDFFLISTPNIVFIIICTIFMVFILVRLWFLRYPPSGEKYFRKAVRIDPSCAEAHVQLGLIALRRHQKQRGCRMLEKALQLNGDNRQIERKLKSIYQKEFVAFFKGKSQRMIHQEEIITRQREEIRALRSKTTSLENLKGRLSEKADQAKRKTAHTEKHLIKKMTDRIATIRKEHKAEIGAIRASKDSAEEEKYRAQKNFIRLTTEIIEAKAKAEDRTLHAASADVREIMGSNLWICLLEQTRTYLATAEHTFKLLRGSRDKPDFSLVGMELCKALETEINRFLVKPFPEYLNGDRAAFLIVNQIGESKGRPLYFTYLAKVVDTKNFPKITALTLGQYHFILKRALEGEYILSEYNDFLDQIRIQSEITVGKDFLNKLETVAKRYRNTITHESPMSKRGCEHLRDLVFAGDNALLKTCAALTR